MVRILSERIPQPTWSFLVALRSLVAARVWASLRRVLRSPRAVWRLMCWLLPPSTRTVVFVGMCRRITTVSVLLRCWPPLPVPRVNCSSRSRGRRATSRSLGSLRTATVTVLVWTRPLFSVAGMRCHRCPPGSCSNADAALGPSTRNSKNPDRTSNTAWSKSLHGHVFLVDAELLEDELFCVFTTFTRSDFDENSHGRRYTRDGGNTQIPSVSANGNPCHISQLTSSSGGRTNLSAGYEQTRISIHVPSEEGTNRMTSVARRDREEISIHVPSEEERTQERRTRDHVA